MTRYSASCFGAALAAAATIATGAAGLALRAPFEPGNFSTWSNPTVGTHAERSRPPNGGNHFHYARAINGGWPQQQEQSAADIESNRKAKEAQAAMDQALEKQSVEFEWERWEWIKSIVAQWRKNVKANGSNESFLKAVNRRAEDVASFRPS